MRSLDMCETFSSDRGNFLVVSRDPPSKLLEGRALSASKSIWLTRIPGKDCIDPTSIGILMTEVKRFIDNSKGKAVILMDGLEYLISLNTYDRIFQFIGQLRDIVMMSGAILVLPIDTRTLGERELALLERNLKTVTSARAGLDGEESESAIEIQSENGIGV